MGGTVWLSATGLGKGSPSMLSCPRHRGFTIVELIIAMAILIFGAYGIYDQFHKTARRSGPSQQKLLQGQARMLAHQRVAELNACSHEALKAWDPQPNFVQVESQPQFHAKTEKQVLDDGTIEITVTIGWEPKSNTGGQEFPSERLVGTKGLRSW